MERTTCFAISRVHLISAITMLSAKVLFPHKFATILNSFVCFQSVMIALAVSGMSARGPIGEDDTLQLFSVFCLLPNGIAQYN